MVDKLKLEQNPLSPIVERVAELCPAAVVNGRIDFERLKTEWTADIIEPEREQYSFTWVGKNDAIAESNRLIRKTLRLDTGASKDWENTKNLYIVGDNLDALKLLRNSYHKKVKMIYIDPPYNTGNDFVYCDDFAETCKEYMEKTQVCDIDGNRLVANKRDGGHFHSNWCSMMYPRLKIARDLLTDDGAIFISIDDNEVTNLRKICDEVFGESNFICMFTWQKKTQPSFLSKEIANVTEYILAYKKTSIGLCLKGGYVDNLRDNELINIGNPIQERVLPADAVEIERGKYNGLLPKGKYGNGVLEIELLNDVAVSKGVPDSDLRLVGRFVRSQETLLKDIKNGAKIFIRSTKTLRPTINLNKQDPGIKPPISLLSKKLNEKIPTNTDASSEIKSLFGGINIMDYPKPSGLIRFFVDALTYDDKKSIVLDFFSGSATTAHAVMQLNAEDGGQRKFIMVQLPEATDEKSEAFKAGYHDISEIGMERIRRAGDKIATENPDKQIDTGFRVLRIDSTNMKDVYYTPAETTKASLLDSVDNIKQGRTEMDLLFGVMVDRGLKLDMPIETAVLNNITYYRVNNGDLVACFADNLPENFIHEIANQKPDTVVFRDSSFAEPKDKINLTEIFKTISPKTEVYVF